MAAVAAARLHGKLRPMTACQHLPILGSRIASVTYSEAVEIILERAARPASHAYVCAANVHCVSMARRDPAYREALNGSLLTVPDGQPLVWAHRLLRGRRLPDRVYGPTLMLKLCEAAAARGVSIYLYGGKSDVPEALAAALRGKYPALRVAGAFSPPFGDRPPDDPELDREIKAINNSGAGLVFIGLGAPRQEFFMARHTARIRPVMIGVGAAFDFHAGRVPQAPPWMQRRGLEWLFRLGTEPRRLWKRYLFYNPYFLARLMLQVCGLDRPSRELAAALVSGSPDAVA